MSEAQILASLAGLAAVALPAWLVYVGHRAHRADWGGFGRNCLDGWLRIYCRRFHRLQAEPLQLPAQGGAILVANHVSGLDPFLLVSACERPLRFMIAVEEYQRFGMTWLFRLGGCIPVDRSGRVEQAFRSAVRALKAGEIVALFPHGKIHLDSEPHHAIKPGVLKLATLAQVPICPARIVGVAGAGQVVGSLLARSEARVLAYTPYDAEAIAAPDFRAHLGCLLLGRTPLDPGQDPDA
ncbi:MAG: 1-acyl-sn-glycerol-3-phosphate acyltransferase [Gammaproteobacteria bacterium]|nr:1-acyl-sn-glycerol-3-phosphate acyltransferase [Gammaproteobacteria bacterium]